MTIRYRTVLGLLATAGLSSMLQGQATFPVDFRIGAHTASTKRNISLSDAVTGHATATVRGFDAILASPDGGAGIGARLLQGTYEDGDFSLQEGMLLAGQRSFHVEAGYGRRSLFGTDSTVTFARAGARSTVQIGGSGVSLDVQGSAYFPGDFTKQKSPTPGSKDLSTLLGWEGETNIFYTVPRVPVYLQLGYKAQYFTFGQRAEYMNGVVIGTGIWLGGR